MSQSGVPASNVPEPTSVEIVTEVKVATEPVELEIEPATAAVLFGPQIAAIRTFTNNLADQGEILGLIGPLELPRLWSRHILNCAIVAPLLRPGLVGDVGSGAGLPGLVLAIARPDVNFVLIEPMERRVAWLNDQVVALNLTNVSVVRARAEEAHLAHPLDQVTARAVSAFRKLIPLTAPLLRSGGELILMKGEGAQREIEAAAKPIRNYRLRDVEVITLGAGVLNEVTRVIRATVE
ncbi:MAG: 16S rRNA (guanine(527)-N(7))-methyltransferase RsmG [Cryobacterium sp.]|uniref:16S rRNA (guanine(527)-N(7))-methyltransferase RsmG n=1 Tax=unclassified Cryobacterium TaxID=2649013 RepID=UPI0018CBE2BF|nr:MULTISPECIES: 16S rRNA (guanine(527)-N(7))-methyltransferase RsmG [unclassified Cryobacterium]MCY7404036.1 16S rRNA (guanine(527)-N(7))-methyltransferase RsmG [Cryobacterium sp.]MEC5153729.1 16S rRNA (guanine527-N7)-methyltransferase [Cryobacterium sp. CAN_C3]